MKYFFPVILCFAMMMTSCSELDPQNVNYGWEESTEAQQVMGTPVEETEPIVSEPEITIFSETENLCTLPEIEVPYIPDEELVCLDNTQCGFGQGVQFDENGRPYGATQFNDKFSKYSAYAVNNFDDNTVWLTFDLGYENGYTEIILDTLKEKNVKAIFFVTGGYCKYADPAIIQRIIDEGHILGNHGQNHKSLASLLDVSIEDAEKELTEIEDYIYETYGYEMKYMRPPEGVYSERALALAQRMGYKTLFWSFAYADWDVNNQPDKSEAFNKITANPHSGQIILLHAVSETNTEILDEVIDEYRHNGYEFTIPAN